MIEFGQTPIDETKFSLLMINHNIVWLDITMHDTHGMAEIIGKFYSPDIHEWLTKSQGLSKFQKCNNEYHNQSMFDKVA